MIRDVTLATSARNRSPCASAIASFSSQGSAARTLIGSWVPRASAAARDARRRRLLPIG